MAISADFQESFAFHEFANQVAELEAKVASGEGGQRGSLRANLAIPTLAERALIYLTTLRAIPPQYSVLWPINGDGV